MTEFGVVIPSWGDYGDPARIRDVIVAAEELGFHTAWFGDHVIIPDYAAHVSPPNWYEPLACCIYGAGLTTTLRFGTDVLVLPYRNPVALAKMLSTADQLCGGRLTLGVGVGYVSGEFAALGTPPYEQRGAVTDEYLAVLHTLWDADGSLSFDGRYVHLHEVQFAPGPAQRPFPVWVGGNGAAAYRRAARYGTGWHPLFPTVDAYRAGREAILRRRADTGRSGPFAFSYSCPHTRVVVGRDDAPAHSATYADLGPVPDEYNYAPAVPTTPDGRPRFIGTPDQLVADIAEFVDAGVDHFALRFWAGTPGVTPSEVIDQMRAFREHVAPAFAA
ncbi:MAG TPA: TIGR03619 family F420-dependent LLM class oxidoreductase [Acidimicrobiia bacterium]|nr:TIGR03619 family F420-dependent LLM class oxidoreductase [Acidimicrobiia bacterium]